MRQTRAAIDFVIVVLFVGIGRTNHHDGVTFAGMVSTLWPFVIGLVVGWTVLTVSHRSGASLSDGLVVCLGTVSIGMVLRVISGQGTAVAFVLVALGFLGAAMIGWRALTKVVQHRRGNRGVA